jgi:hypothetical protein
VAGQAWGAVRHKGKGTNMLRRGFFGWLASLMGIGAAATSPSEARSSSEPTPWIEPPELPVTDAAIRATCRRLSHASGALSDIMTLVTSCVPRDASPEVRRLAEGVLRRILASADHVRSAPSYYIHGWEETAWRDYLDGGAKGCAEDRPCLDAAKQYAEHARWSWIWELRSRY